MPGQELFSTLQDAYGIQTSTYQDLGGSSCLNLRSDSERACYVVRVYRPYVTQARLEAIQYVKDALGAHGVPCVRPLETVDGRRWTVWGERLVEVEPYVAHDGCMDSPERVALGLPLLGHIHSIMRTLTLDQAGRAPLFANYLAPEEMLHRTREGCDRIRGWGPSDEELWLADGAEELAAWIARYDGEITHPIPRQLAHGDFWDNNVLFAGDDVVLVTDFDFMGERRRIDDLALTLYFMSDVAEPDSWSTERISQLVGLTDLYARHLSPPLAETERLALPLTIARQPLWSFGVWIAGLDCEETARGHASGMQGYVDWGLRIMRELETWQDLFLDGGVRQC